MEAPPNRDANAQAYHRARDTTFEAMKKARTRADFADILSAIKDAKNEPLLQRAIVSGIRWYLDHKRFSEKDIEKFIQGDDDVINFYLYDMGYVEAPPGIYRPAEEVAGDAAGTPTTPTVSIHPRYKRKNLPAVAKENPVIEDPTETPEYKALSTPAEQMAFLERALGDLEEKEKAISRSAMKREAVSEALRGRLGEPIPLELPVIEKPAEERVENIQYGDAIQLVNRGAKGYEHNAPSDFAADYAAEDVADQEAIEREREDAQADYYRDLYGGQEPSRQTARVPHATRVSGNKREFTTRSVQREPLSEADIERNRVENISRLDRVEKTVEARRMENALKAARANDELTSELHRRAPAAMKVAESAAAAKQARQREETRKQRRDLIRGASEALFGETIDDSALDDMGEEDELQLAKSIYRELGGIGSPGYLRRPYKRRAVATEKKAKAAPRKTKKNNKKTVKRTSAAKKHTTRRAAKKVVAADEDKMVIFVDEEIAAAELVSKIGKKKKGAKRGAKSTKSKVKRGGKGGVGRKHKAAKRSTKAKKSGKKGGKQAKKIAARGAKRSKK